MSKVLVEPVKFKAYVGDIVWIEVMVAPRSDAFCNTVKFGLNYDPNLLEALDIVEDKVFLSQFGSPTFTKGTIDNVTGSISQTTCALQSGAYVTAGNGAVARVEFRLKGQTGSEKVLSFSDAQTKLISNTGASIQYVKYQSSYIILEPPDIIPPTAITNLAANPVSPTSVNLTWTATGDDGPTGTATSYDIRYSNAEITEANWASATQVSGEPSPQVSGSAETFIINNLAAGKYYFAIKTTDDKGNVSIISNTASATMGKPGDANLDGHVNFSDFIILAVNYNTNSSSPNWDSRADFDNNGKIDFSDFIILAVNYESSS